MMANKISRGLNVNASVSGTFSLPIFTTRDYWRQSIKGTRGQSFDVHLHEVC